MPRRIAAVLAVTGLLVCVPLHVAGAAGSETMAFDSQQEYDIYFYSSESSTSVLENVNILGFKTIGGKEFLVIRSKGFKLTEESGYVDFAAVIAILPDSHFRVRKSDGIRIRNKY